MDRWSSCSENSKIPFYVSKYDFPIFSGEELVYLDPHTTQLAVDFTSRDDSDESFHCAHSSRMKILDLDPSIALVRAYP